MEKTGPILIQHRLNPEHIMYLRIKETRMKNRSAIFELKAERCTDIETFHFINLVISQINFNFSVKNVQSTISLSKTGLFTNWT